MKKALKVVAVNAGVLAALLVVLEAGLRIAGRNTIFGLEKKLPGWEGRVRILCEKIRTRPVEFYDSFVTGDDGIFRANPAFYRKRGAGGSDDPGVNEDGFRGHPFIPAAVPGPKILFVGDSFVWGAGARPLSECFADIVGRAGYHVYNGGIPGTDPMQYAVLAEKYVPLLKPDAVAVCIYLGMM